MIMIKYGSGAAEAGKREEAEEGKGGRLKEGVLSIGKSLGRHLPLKETFMIAGIALASQALPSCALDLTGKINGKEDVAVETDTRETEIENEQGEAELEFPDESPLEENDANDIDAEAEPEALDEPDVSVDPDAETTDVAPDDLVADDTAVEDAGGDDGPCTVYSETQSNITITLGSAAIVGNVNVEYAEEISAGMDRFEISYCDSTLVDADFRVAEYTGANQDYASYTFNIFIRNKGSSGGTVTIDATVTDY